MQWALLVYFGTSLVYSHDMGTEKNCLWWAEGAKQVRPAATVVCRKNLTS